MTTTFIYGLADKTTKQIRYIGKSDNPHKRLKKHISNTKLDVKKNKKLTHKDYWLIKENFNVDIIILEECSNKNWSDREKFYIEKYNNLTNTSSGGLGGCGVKYLLTYDEVKTWVKNNVKVSSKNKWMFYCKNNILPDFISTYPDIVYKNRGWVSWGDFLGTGNKWDNNVEHLDYNKAKLFLFNYKLKIAADYKLFIKDNNYNLPSKPNRYYKNRGWVSWGDFLGTGKVANQLRVFYPYDIFKEKIKELKIKSFYSYKKYIKTNKTDNKLPTNPNIVYKNKGWVSWCELIF
jgi:hypothetical protein